MNARAYVLIDAAKGKTEQVLRALWGRPGIALIDCLEGPPDVIMVAEATERLELAEFIIQALTSVEHLIDGIQCLPVSDEGVGCTPVQNKGGRR